MDYDNMRNGDWMQTFTGQKFRLSDPRPEDIRLLDIAQGLSNECRYGGHCKFHYSVAQHSVLLYDVVPLHLKKSALIHDIPEAYTKDFVRANKVLFSELQALDKGVEACIWNKYGFNPVDPDLKAYDVRITLDERNALFDEELEWEIDNLEPLGLIIRKMTPEEARLAWIVRFASEWPELAGEITDDCFMKGLIL